MVRLHALRTIVLAAAFAVAAPAAHVAPPAHGAEDKADPNAPSDKDIARSVEIIGLVFPVFDDGYKLRNYLFVNARFVVADGKDIWQVREQAHLIRDAVLRQAHKHSFHVGDDYQKFDTERATRECLEVGNRVVGDGAFASLTFTQITLQSTV